MPAIMDGTAGGLGEQDTGLESALEERRNAEALAGFSGRPVIGDIGHATSNALKGPGETWDQDEFIRKPSKKDKEEVCMVEILESPGKYLQAYFLDWSQSEVHLRIPVSNEENRLEWVNLKSSRLWRGQMSTKFWKHIANGIWEPKPAKGKAGKKRKPVRTDDHGRPARHVNAGATDSEGQQDTGLAMHSTRQASLNTMSGSLRTPRSAGWDFEGHAHQPEISSQDQGPDSEAPTDQPQSNDDRGATRDESDRALEMTGFMRNWQKGHLEKLAQSGQLDLPLAADCNWESGNTNALKRFQGEKEDKSGMQSLSCAPSKSQLHINGIQEKGRISTVLKDSCPGLHSGPRSPSPSTPNKGRQGFRGQNSSSEDADPRSNRAANGVKALGKQGPHSHISASSPRSIDNVRAQQERKLSEAWRQNEGHEQNSGSSSSSGKDSGGSPTTVLLNGDRTKAAVAKGLRAKKVSKANDAKAPSGTEISAPGAATVLPLKKRMKLALVETDPFAS